MPVDPIYLQRRVAPIGRIRLGKKVVTKSGKQAPAKLDRFRLTTPYQWAAQAVADVYGGTIAAWADDMTNDRWQVETDTTELDVIVLPSLIPGESAVSQWFERWSAGGCTHRCTGTTAYIADGHTYSGGIPCDGQNGTCGEAAREVADEQRRDGIDAKDRETVCQIKTRLSVVLPQVAGTGQWRLDTASWNAAAELGGIGDWLVLATAAGYSVPATLAMTQVKRSRYVRGKPVTYRFAMPTLIARISQQAVVAIEQGDAYRPELDGIEITPIEPRRPLQLDPAHPDTPPPRRPGGRHRTVDTVVAPPAHDPPTASEAATAEQVELAAQAARQQRHDWFEALPFSPEDPEVGEMFALCAQRWDATYDNVSQTVRDRVARGLAQVQAGELRIDREGGETRLVKIPSGDVALSLAAEEVQPS
jgi:hypothetical protein